MRKKISMGRTYNLGNYESLRLDVGFEDESGRSWLELYQDCKVCLGEMEEDQNVVNRVERKGGKGHVERKTPRSY